MWDVRGKRHFGNLLTTAAAILGYDMKPCFIERSRNSNYVRITIIITKNTEKNAPSSISVVWCRSSWTGDLTSSQQYTTASYYKDSATQSIYRSSYLSAYFFRCPIDATSILSKIAVSMPNHTTIFLLSSTICREMEALSNSHNNSDVEWAINQ